MTQETTEIEVEVLEIDGVAPVPAKEVQPTRGDWRQWGSRVRRLDIRWWPLWVVLGGIALFLALTLGLVLGVIYTVFRIIRALFRAVFG